MGYHSFHWEATDSSGNKADCQFVVAVDSKKCPSFQENRSQEWKNNFEYEVTDKSCVNRDGATVKITCKGGKKLRFSNAMIDKNGKPKYLSQINAHCKNGQWLDPTLIATCEMTDEEDYDDYGVGKEFEDKDTIDDEIENKAYENYDDNSTSPPETPEEDNDENDYDSDSSENAPSSEDEITNNDENLPETGGSGGTVVVIIILVILASIGGIIAFKRYKDNIKIAQNLGRTILSGKDNGGMNLGGDTNQAYSPM